MVMVTGSAIPTDKEKGMYTVYGKPDCPQCEQAKALLKNRGYEFTYVDIVNDPSKRTVLMVKVENAIGRLPRSLPVIFEGEKYIGGLDDINHATIPF